MTGLSWIRAHTHNSLNGDMGVPSLWGFSAACMAALLLLSVPLHAADEFVYRSPAGVSFHVTGAGLSSIGVGDREIAAGGWHAFNAEGWFKDGGSGKAMAANKFGQTLAILDARHARVRHEGADAVCIFDYSFEGEDALISARIENNNADWPINITGFTGLSFTFAQPPTGLMPVQHISYFQAHGVRLCHPGQWQQIGGTYAADDSVGVGTSPMNTGLTRTLTLWDYASWSPDQRDKSPKRLLRYFIVSPVPPRGAATFDSCLRVSPNRDWKHLLDPYRKHFQKTFGPVQYQIDPRFVATDYLNRDQKSISPANPYGFHDGARRIDTADGAKAFCDRIIPALKQANGQGAIVWGQGGDDPRGAMYRPDFDILPPEVEANWPTISSRFKEAGLKLGVATRPRDMAVRRNWKSDEVIPVNPDSPEHRDMLWNRFDNMLKHGCTLFYLDSFGDSFEDMKLMRSLREKLGPSVLTFAEHQCDAIFPFTGGYSETTFSIVEGKPHYRLWSGLENWEIYQWLCPGAQMAARLYEAKGKIPADNPPDDWFYANRITPLLPVSDFGSRLSTIGAIQAKHLSDQGTPSRQ